MFSTKLKGTVTLNDVLNKNKRIHDIHELIHEAHSLNKKQLPIHKKMDQERMDIDGKFVPLSHDAESHIRLNKKDYRNMVDFFLRMSKQIGKKSSNDNEKRYEAWIFKDGSQYTRRNGGKNKRPYPEPYYKMDMDKYEGMGNNPMSNDAAALDAHKQTDDKGNHYDDKPNLTRSISITAKRSVNEMNALGLHGDTFTSNIYMKKCIWV